MAAQQTAEVFISYRRGQSARLQPAVAENLRQDLGERARGVLASCAICLLNGHAHLKSKNQSGSARGNARFIFPAYTELIKQKSTPAGSTTTELDAVSAYEKLLNSYC